LIPDKLPGFPVIEICIDLIHSMSFPNFQALSCLNPAAGSGLGVEISPAGSGTGPRQQPAQIDLLGRPDGHGQAAVARHPPAGDGAWQVKRFLADTWNVDQHMEVMVKVILMSVQCAKDRLRRKSNRIQKQIRISFLSLSLIFMANIVFYI
jgi:hypothetical protein